MKILITGGTGLIGKPLVASLLADGDQVTVLTRDPEQTRPELPHGAVAVKWDGKTPDGWGHLIDQTDVR